MHKRLGHINKDYLLKSELNNIKDLKISKDLELTNCDSCYFAKFK